MTRQKKEIIKKIDQIHMWICVDEELGIDSAAAGKILFGGIYNGQSDF